MTYGVPRPRTYKAVVKYPSDATDAEKIRALRDGLGECACELRILGVSLEDIEDWCDEASAAAEHDVSPVDEHGEPL